MLNLKIIVPLLVLALQVIMKFVVGRRVEGKNYLELVCELPTNIIFLSISFSLLHIFLIEPITQKSVIVFLFFVVLALIIVEIFRECRHLSDSVRTRGKTILLIILILINFPISLGCLYYASEQLMNKTPAALQFQTPETKKIDKCKQLQ